MTAIPPLPGYKRILEINHGSCASNPFFHADRVHAFAISRDDTRSAPFCQMVTHTWRRI